MNAAPAPVSVGDEGVLDTHISAALSDVWIDRDLSWLDFNERVLAEALDERTPLLERAKFLAIFTANLDEFFMKRIAVLRDTDPRTPEAHRTASGETAAYAVAAGRVLSGQHRTVTSASRHPSMLLGRSDRSPKTRGRPLFRHRDLGGSDATSD